MVLGVIRVDRHILGVGRRVLRVDKEVLPVDKRELPVEKWVLQVGEEYYEQPDKYAMNTTLTIDLFISTSSSVKLMKKLFNFLAF